MAALLRGGGSDEDTYYDCSYQEFETSSSSSSILEWEERQRHQRNDAQERGEHVRCHPRQKFFFEVKEGNCPRQNFFFDGEEDNDNSKILVYSEEDTEEEGFVLGGKPPRTFCEGWSEMETEKETKKRYWKGERLEPPRRIQQQNINILQKKSFQQRQELSRTRAKLLKRQEKRRRRPSPRQLTPLENKKSPVEISEAVSRAMERMAVPATTPNYFLDAATDFGEVCVGDPTISTTAVGSGSAPLEGNEATRARIAAKMMKKVVGEEDSVDIPPQQLENEKGGRTLSPPKLTPSQLRVGMNPRKQNKKMNKKNVITHIDGTKTTASDVVKPTPAAFTLKKATKPSATVLPPPQLRRQPHRQLPPSPLPPRPVATLKKKPSSNSLSSRQQQLAATTPWVRDFLARTRRDVLLPVPRDYLADHFNLHDVEEAIEAVYGIPIEAAKMTMMKTGKQQQQQPPSIFKETLQLILSRDGSLPADDSAPCHPPATVCAAAESIYALVHARYITSPRGLDAVRRLMLPGNLPAAMGGDGDEEKERYSCYPAVFGRCPRTSCGGNRLLPIGRSDEIGVGTAMRYCCCCGEAFALWDSGADGAAWGTSFAHLLLLSYGTELGLVSINKDQYLEEEEVERWGDRGASSTRKGRQGSLLSFLQEFDSPKGVGMVPVPQVFGFRIHPMRGRVRYPLLGTIPAMVPWQDLP